MEYKDKRRENGSSAHKFDKNKGGNKGKRFGEKRNFEQRELPENVIYGRNAILELLKREDASKYIEKIYIKSGEREGSLRLIESKAIESKVSLIDARAQKLDELALGASHQGVVAICAEKEYVDIDDILAIAEERGEKPFLVICDGVEDPHNLGAIIRSAECAGAHGVIIPKRRSSGLTAVVSKSSAGALTHMAIARVPNLASAVDELKEKGVWIYAAEAGGTYYYDCDITGAVAIIMGGEDSGVSRILMDKSDFVLSIPMHGKINSLNVSAAAAVLLNEAAIQRAGVKRCK